MKSSTLVLVVAVLALCFSVAFAENEQKNATQSGNMTNVTGNMTNVTTNATNMTNVTTNATNMTNATTPFEGAKGVRRY